jgi:uncharacterized protein GlcG (DUF336 family)
MDAGSGKGVSSMFQQSTVSLEDARRMIAGGEAKARDIGQPMNVAIVDNGGNLVAFAHMDGAWKGSVDIAIDKAFTSAMFELPTEGLSRRRNRASRSCQHPQPVVPGVDMPDMGIRQQEARDIATYLDAIR